MKDFEFYVANIEDSILALLEQQMKPLGVKSFDLYSGDLGDPETLKKALGAMSLNFPLVLVSYTDGVDTLDPKTAPVLGKPRTYRHDCSFVVICASNDARGENARRRGKAIKNVTIGTYTMISKVRELLSDLRLKVVVGEGEDAETVLLTTDVLTPQANEYLTRMSNITAYAVIFDTAFKYSTLDRSAAGTPVTEFILDVESRNASSQTNNVPGVNFNQEKTNV